jgi:hypothetical protein
MQRLVLVACLLVVSLLALPAGARADHGRVMIAGGGQTLTLMFGFAATAPAPADVAVPARGSVFLDSVDGHLVGQVVCLRMRSRQDPVTGETVTIGDIWADVVESTDPRFPDGTSFFTQAVDGASPGLDAIMQPQEPDPRFQCGPLLRRPPVPEPVVRGEIVSHTSDETS